MQTQLPVAQTITTETTAENRLILDHVSWETYEQLLVAFGEHRAVRFHYDNGVIEFMVPLEAHENPSDLLGLLICTLVVESGLNLKCMASTTLKRKHLQKGAEPDKCYYIQNEPLVRGRTVDLEKDPPPDLVVEIDITHTDIDKNALYASMGVPEFWRFNGSVLSIYQLEQDQYHLVDVSPALPWVSKDVIYRFLRQSKTVGEAQALRDLKGWIKQQLDSLDT
ncbi:Uma2 family endonuclease [Acaryochloris sp. CCMEE 5410]|uniref:Uma2 family endonuclease n=1 Tax=Acaryochloris sp. CCMEE 5410 TaxID=310037 RepID=UPI00024848FE|nr:Uma2 family endonuclease [Acaryochloris sp. CCMEE 5410]KAI9132727.1 Uma2 family endonuclease [Acaryochloris sp. CCMEE 5410]